MQAGIKWKARTADRQKKKKQERKGSTKTLMRKYNGLTLEGINRPKSNEGRPPWHIRQNCAKRRSYPPIASLASTGLKREAPF